MRTDKGMRDSLTRITLSSLATLVAAILPLMWADRPAAAGPARERAAPAVPEPAGMKAYPTQYYAVHTDLPPDAAREAGLRMTRMAEEYHNRTKGVGTGVIKDRLPFYLFAKAADYHAAGGPGGSIGVFYHGPAGSWLMATNDVPGGRADELWHTVQHEGFHQFAHHVLGGGDDVLPVWLNEGLADYFGEAVWTGDGFVLGGVPRGRLATLRKELKAATVGPAGTGWGGSAHFRPFADVLVMTRGQWRAGTAYEYDQAWSIAHFLVHADGGKYQPAFASFIADVSKKQPWPDAWQRRLGPADPIGARWREWWLAQADDPTADLYAQATTATLTSFLARAAAKRQTFADFPTFADDARAGKLQPDADDWLPPALLAAAVKAVDAGGAAGGGVRWALQTDAAKAMHVAATTPSGARLLGNYRIDGRRVGRVWVDVLPPAGTAPKLDKPVPVVTTRADKMRLAGRVAGYDAAGFQMLDDRGTVRTVKWSDLPAQSVLDVYNVLLAKGTGEDWVAAGRVLYALADGKPAAERAFGRAVWLDPGLKAAVDEAKAAPTASAGAVVAAAGVKAGGTNATATTTTRPAVAAAPAATPPTAPNATPPSGAAVVPAVPRTPRRPPPPPADPWPELDAAGRAEAVQALKDLVASTRAGRGGKLAAAETTHFLLYSDLPAREARECTDLLERMNARLAAVFGLDAAAADAVWPGKALVVVLSDAGEAVAFEKDAHRYDVTDPGATAHLLNNGGVHVVVYRRPGAPEFGHMMVDQAANGFLFRYRGRARVPAWVELGLGRTFAFEVAPIPDRQQRYRDDARRLVAEHGLGEEFFAAAAADRLAGWQVPVAQTAVAFMLETNEAGFAAFVDGLKAGQPPADSLERNFGMTPAQLSAAFKASLAR